MAEVIDIERFLSLSAHHTVIDVRTSSEFRKGHIPGALNIPLFNEEERSLVGTAYKQESRQEAIFRGLEIAGKKLTWLAGEGLNAAGSSHTLLLHCWRGGMRSSSMAWLFELVGIRCYLLEGGYRSFRRMVHSRFGVPLHLQVVGGCTGSGKTELLHYLRDSGEQVIDLEGLANHKGSAFGGLGEDPQPSTEHFENLIGMQLVRLDLHRRIWIEDESRNIGKCVLPIELYNQMKEGTLLFLNIPRDRRARYLTQNYAVHHKEQLKSCVGKIEKRLGGARATEAREAIDHGDFYHAAQIMLHYYDKSYMHSLERNHHSYEVISSGEVDTVKNALLLRKYVEEQKE